MHLYRGSHFPVLGAACSMPWLLVLLLLLHLEGLASGTPLKHEILRCVASTPAASPKPSGHTNRGFSSIFSGLPWVSKRAHGRPREAGEEESGHNPLSRDERPDTRQDNTPNHVMEPVTGPWGKNLFQDAPDGKNEASEKKPAKY